MPLNSVNTNPAALTGLHQLAATRADFAAVRRRVATGMRVVSARDDGAIWGIAQRQRGDIRALDSVARSLERGRSMVDVAIVSGERISNLLIQMREKALATADGGLSAESRAALNQEFVLLRDQITRVVETASFDGGDLLSENAKDRSSWPV